MKNIYEILKGAGIEITEEQKSTIDKELSENYKTIAEVEKIKGKLTTAETNYANIKKDLEKRDSDLSDLQKQLKTAGEDATKLKDVQTKFETLTNTYAEAKQNWEKQLNEQKHEFLEREKANGLKFTSEGAKRTFLSDLRAKNLPVENDALLGFDDFVKAYKEADAGAFVVEEEKKKDVPPPFVTHSGGKPDNTGNNNSAFGFNFIGVRERPNNNK